MKTCRKCKVEKALDEFPTRAAAADGRGYVCRVCMRAATKASREKRLERDPEYRDRHNARVRARYATDPDFRAKRLEYDRKRYESNTKSRERRAERMRHYHRNYKFGVTVEMYDEMFEAQGGVCAICKGLPVRTKNLHIDHDHATDRVRGLLCESCNLGLGKFKDSPELLEVAAAYLRAAKTAFTPE